VASSAFYRELDFIFIGSNSQAIRELLKLFADLGEFAGVDGDD
jgi:hypothetical protein